MATAKEIQLTLKLVEAAIKVNASNDQVGVEVDVRSSCVCLRITPDRKTVLHGGWDWVFCADNPAFFSNEFWEESLFIERCEAFIAEVNKHLVATDADGVPV